MLTLAKQLEINNSRMEFEEEVATFKKGNINFSCYFQHVIQRAYLDKELLVGDVAWYYHDQIVGNFKKYGVLPICQVIMPSHIHELYYCNNVVDISRLRSVACRNATVFAKKMQKENNYKKIIPHLFEPNPGYVAIKDSRQLMVLLKYIRDNDLYLKEIGKKAPYSSFDKWENSNFYKPFALEGLEHILGMRLEEIKQLIQKDRADVLAVSKTLNTDKKMFIHPVN